MGFLASKKKNEDKILPGSSEPQDLGSVSYKDTLTQETTQQTQSVDTTSAVVSEVLQGEEKILPDEAPEIKYMEQFMQTCLKPHFLQIR